MKLRIAQGITCNLAVALAVQEDVGRFLVAVNDVSRVEVVGGAEQLVHDEALVHLLQDVAFPAKRIALPSSSSQMQLFLRIILSSLHLRCAPLS